MPGKPLSTQQIAALWRAYKIRQTARFVARHCSVSQHTAEKYILNHNFATRFAKLQARANEIVDEDQAQSLANTLKPLSNIRTILLQDALTHAQKGELKATISDIDKVVRLERYLRGEPDTRTEQGGTFEWLEVDPEKPDDPEIFRHQEKM